MTDREILQMNAYVAHCMHDGITPLYNASGQRLLEEAAESEGKTPDELHDILFAEAKENLK